MTQSVNIFDNQFLLNLQNQCKNRLKPTKSILQALKFATNLNNQYKEQIHSLKEQLQSQRMENSMLSDMLEQLQTQNQQYKEIKQKRWKIMNDKQTQLQVQNQTLKNINQVLVKQVELLKKKIKSFFAQDKQNSLDCSVQFDGSLFQSARFNNYVNFQDKQHSTSQNTKVRLSLDESFHQKEEPFCLKLKNMLNNGPPSNQNLQTIEFKKIVSSEQIPIDSPRFKKRQSHQQQTKQEKEIEKIQERNSQIRKQKSKSKSKSKDEQQKSKSNITDNRRLQKQYTFYKIQTNKSIQQESNCFNIQDSSSISKHHNVVSDSSGLASSNNEYTILQLSSQCNIDQSGLLKDIFSNTTGQNFFRLKDKERPQNPLRMRKTTSAVLTPEQARRIQQNSKRQAQQNNNDNKITKKQVQNYPKLNLYNQTQSYKTIYFNKQNTPKKDEHQSSIKTIQMNNNSDNKSKQSFNSGLKSSVLKGSVMCKSTAIINKNRELLASKIRSKQKKNTYSNIHSRKGNEQQDNQDQNLKSSQTYNASSNQTEQTSPVFIVYDEELYSYQQ